MIWKDMPPLAALRAFSAFAETGNVVKAGEAINVTHAAISQHLRALERDLGIALFDRSGRALALTPEGRRLADALTAGFGGIAAAVRELSQRDAARPVHVSATPSFAAMWLMPRLSAFRLAHPDISLTIDPTPALADLTPGGIDIALRFGRGNWPGLDSTLLIETGIVLVGAPALVGHLPEITPADLVDLPWLEELGTTEATQWLRDRGVSEDKARHRVQVPGNLVLQGARDAQGVAVTTRLFVEADVAAGRLVVLFEEPRDSRTGYYLVTRPGVQRPAVRAFTTWLRRAAREAEAMHATR